MSVHVMSWVLRHSEEKLGARLVLLVLADRAREDGTHAWPSVESIARDARLSRRQVQRCLRDLEATGAITATGKHDSGTTIWGVNMAPPGATSTTAGGDKTTPEPSEDQPSGETANAVSLRGTEYEAPRTVDRRPVTATEAQTAAVVLHVWNELSGQQLRAKEWLGKIIMRLREYPEATVSDHRLIIETNLANPWWKGAATPSVIYGNGAQFERAIQATRAAKDDDDRVARIVEAVQARRAS